MVDPGSGDRMFGSLEPVELTAANADHVLTPLPFGQTPIAPYEFFLENAFAPVQGSFVPNTASSVEDVGLLFGGETIPRIAPPNSQGCPSLSEGAICVNSGSCGGNNQTPCDGQTMPKSEEVRFDVISTPQGLFNASVGGTNISYEIDNAQAPATIYVEGVVEEAQGVFNKVNIANSLTAELLIDGVVVASGTSGENDGNAVVLQQMIPQ